MNGKGGVLAEIARRVEVSRQKAIDSPLLRAKWRKLNHGSSNPGTPKQRQKSFLSGILEHRKTTNLTRTNSDFGPIYYSTDEEQILEDILRAIRENKLKKIKSLLKERKLNPNVLNFSGVGPLHEACYYGYLKCVRLLVDNGADVHFADSEGWTPLFAAVCGGHMEIVKFLTENKAVVNCADIYGVTPLRVAVVVGSLEMVEYLVKQGAEVMAIADDGKSPFQVAIELADDVILAFFLHNPSFHIT